MVPFFKSNSESCKYKKIFVMHCKTKILWVSIKFHVHHIPAKTVFKKKNKWLWNVKDRLSGQMQEIWKVITTKTFSHILSCSGDGSWICFWKVRLALNAIWFIGTVLVSILWDYSCSTAMFLHILWYQWGPRLKIQDSLHELDDTTLDSNHLQDFCWITNRQRNFLSRFCNKYQYQIYFIKISFDTSSVLANW